MLKNTQNRIKSFLRIAKIRNMETIKLHLGAGGIKMKGYYSVDSLPLDNTDIILDINKLKKYFKQDSITSIYASHVFEHFSHEGIKVIFKDMYGLLKKGGTLRISVPDIDKIVKIYVDNWKHFQTYGNSPWIGLIYGGQTTKFDYHLTGYNFIWMKYLLEQAGFKDVREYNADNFLKKFNIRDSSLGDGTFNRRFSLNVIAYK